MPLFFDLDIPVYDLVGLTGATVYVGAYILAALDMLPSQSWRYYLFNLVAGALVLTGLLGGDFNLAAAVIQVFFIAVSVLGILLHLGRRQRARACERARVALTFDDAIGER